MFNLLFCKKPFVASHVKYMRTMYVDIWKQI